MRPAWKWITPQRVSGTSWSTVHRCTATRRSADRSASRTSSRSAATCRSATGCGRRSRATPATPPTATSTPTTTSPASSPLVSRAATCPRRPRRPTTPSAPTAPSTSTSPTSSTGARSAQLASPSASAGLPTWSRLSTPSCSGTGGTRARYGSSGCCEPFPRPGCGSARCPTRSPTASSARPSNCRPAPGVPARTGRCGPVSRSPIWSN